MFRQQTSKTESESYDDSYEQRLPILADLVLYYCRYAAWPALIQLYQAEVKGTIQHSHTVKSALVPFSGAVCPKYPDGDFFY